MSQSLQTLLIPSNTYRMSTLDDHSTMSVAFTTRLEDSQCAAKKKIAVCIRCVCQLVGK